MIPFDETAVLNLLYESDIRLTVRQYIKKINRLLNISSKQAKRIVQTLVDRQELAYHYIYGSTYIEQSFSKPVRITEHFTLVPAQIKLPPSKNHISIIIRQGIAFGSGQHPTTRMCLEAVDQIFFTPLLPEKPVFGMGADIGTGSGILALAMCLSGLGLCNAYEIDPVSVAEARNNISLNKMESRITVIDDYITPRPDRFSIICANLRYPTLMTLSDLIRDSLEEKGILILSGFRPEETIEILSQYKKLGFAELWQKEQNRWSSLILKKQGLVRNTLLI